MQQRSATGHKGGGRGVGRGGMLYVLKTLTPPSNNPTPTYSSPSLLPPNTEKGRENPIIDICCYVHSQLISAGSLYSTVHSMQKPCVNLVKEEKLVSSSA